MNTKQKGIYRFIAYQDGDRYVAVCLELNIIEYGENLSRLKKSIEETVSAYINVVRTQNLPDSYLNRNAPVKYFKIFDRIQKIARLDKKELEKKSNSHFNSASFSYRQYDFA